jgi:mRNA interferase HigB
MMHIISSSKLKEFFAKHPNAEPSLRAWNKITASAQWQNFVELRETFPSADQVSRLIVFSIGGNKYRLIVYIDYKYQKVFIRHVLTHAEYSEDQWKYDTWFK